ncbi:MAG: hypothetical protein ACYDG2_21155 [Ruminiclostridium sp.]
MIRLNITEAMISFIKEARDKYKIKATDLAVKIDKSSAYISKFDKGDYKTISYNELCQMLSAICDNVNSNEKVEISDEGKKLTDDFLTNCLLNDKDDLYDEDCGLMTYDDVIRTLEIPTDLVDYINSEIEKNKFEISNIINKANENADLGEYAKNPKYEVNTYYSIGEDELKENQANKSEVCFIKVNLEESIVIKILNKEITFYNYLTLKSLLYTIYRLKDIPESLSQLLANNILSQFHFYNLRATNMANFAEDSKNKAFEEMKNMPSALVSTTSNYANLIFSFYKQNPKYTSSKIYGLHKNLSTDAPLVVASLDLPLYKMKDLDADTKRKFLQDVKELINKYTEKKSETKEFQII